MTLPAAVQAVRRVIRAEDSPGAREGRSAVHDLAVAAARAGAAAPATTGLGPGLGALGRVLTTRRRRWLDLGLRVLGSWAAAIGLLLGALALRAG